MVEVNPINILFIHHLSPRAKDVMDALAENIQSEFSIQTLSHPESLPSHTYSLIIMDIQIQAPHELDRISDIRRQAPHTPILILSESDHEAALLKTLKAGAYDFLLGDELHPRSVLKAIRHTLEQQRLMQRLQQLNQQHRHLTTHDQLTGLPNRSLLHDRLLYAMAECQRDKKKFAFLFLDIDNFKTINDTLGHEMGDLLLQRVVGRLSKIIRKTDTLARLGGDEFTILLTHLKKIEDAGEQAKIILDVLSIPFNINQQDLFISASIGMTIYPNDATDIKSLLKNADTAMYQAKAQGRNQYQFYTADMNHMAEKKLNLINSLHQAIKLNQLDLHYQPQIDTTTHKAVGVEALLRWEHPEYGMISPSEFIPLAEQSGLIIPIGEWVLSRAVTQQQAWLEMGLPPIKMSVNLSSQQTEQASLILCLENLLEKTQIDPTLLDLELTESTIAENPDAVVNTLLQAKQFGVRISIDDFGTGYSSLSYLKKFPIDTLKIDRSFVRDSCTNPDDASIITAIIVMARSLHIEVIAEGVETLEQQEFLSSKGCHLIQGYLYSKPLPADECARFLRTML